MIYVIDDDVIMAECITRVIAQRFPAEECEIFTNGIQAIQEINGEVKLIFLDILLDGPDGFAFLNELMSYNDTAKIPVVIVTSLKIKQDLSGYGVVKVLDKSTMKPEEIVSIAEKYLCKKPLHSDSIAGEAEK
ncbi:response regulator [Candidatus Saccharibacteria bacterium]|nr:response regulator [Candidatus Saccharibacteria bacterium]MBR3233400.1 response regulator [Candidatus Saccharibacteria bacterium]